MPDWLFYMTIGALLSALSIGGLAWFAQLVRENRRPKRQRLPPVSEQMTLPLTIDEIPTLPMPAAPKPRTNWPVSHLRAYDVEVDGACLLCGGITQQRGAALQ